MNHQSRPSSNTLLLFLSVFVALLLVRTAWVHEDAYITLRTVDNFVNGYGLTWNVAERVQAYTHPLWMFLLSGLYFFTREAFYTTLVLCWAASLGAFWLAARSAPKLNLATLAVLLVLPLSKSFVDYSTSGLENPLTHLLLAAFLLVYLRSSTIGFSQRAVFGLALLAGLATFNRMDTLLFFLPALFWLWWQEKSWKTLRSLALGFAPFILWEIFSVIYYGFPFPNTAYAKLNTGISRGDLLEQSSLYFINSLRWDPISLFSIGVGLLLAFKQGEWRHKSVAAGVALYLAYLFWIGSDYMSGRFFSAAVLVSVILLAHHLAHLRLGYSLVTLLVVVAVGFMSPTPTITTIGDEPVQMAEPAMNFIYDDRRHYFTTSSLLYERRNQAQPTHEWMQRGLDLRAAERNNITLKHTGFVGYFAGPKVFIVDPLALSDPLLARIPPKPPPAEWVIGHYERAIPEGYIETLKSGTNRISDSKIAALYDQIALVTRGPLWTAERWQAIWRLNTGWQP